ncbi:MAG: pentapeptide repeat-containing protein [Nitrospinae bacterium]|nr:pentapeptide repeat-containing protein [Nitrospinota bacterium]
MADENENPWGYGEEPPWWKRKVPKEDLDGIIAQHKNWIDSKWRGGRKSNLRGADLSRADLSEANLSEADISDANLSGANLSNSDLTRANLHNADLSGANLSGSNLHNADLSGVALSDVDLSNVKLLHTNLSRSNLSRTNLSNINLPNITLSYVNLFNMDLSGSNLSGSYFRDTNLSFANLSKADLSNADLKGTNLSNADLKGTHLSNADFTNATVTFAIFHHANLRNANMETVIDLTTPALGGADVSSAALPENVKKFDGVTAAQNTILMARPVFIALMLGCLYSWLTLFSISHKALVLGDEMFPLPVLQTNIQVQYFFVAGPLILFGLFVYMHHYLKTLWEHFSQLPAVFPDGRTIDKTVYPWMLTSIVYLFVPRLKTADKRPNFWWDPCIYSIITAWIVTPFTILGYLFISLPKHDWYLSGFLYVMFILIALISVSYLFQARGILLIARNMRLNFLQLMLVWLPFVSLAIIAPFFLAWHYPLSTWRTANLSGQELSKRPEKLPWNADIPEMIATVKGANLKGADLRGANLSRSFLFHADFFNAQLQNADLRKADIRCANLRHADLSGAIITPELALSAFIDDKTVLPFLVKVEDIQKSGFGCPPWGS